ncbi:MAG: RNA polymerase sigma factor [Chitinophagaceae bacterium]
MSQSYASYSDDALLDLIQKQKNQAAFGELYTRYAHTVYCICQSYFKDPDRSKEAVMQVFEKLMIEIPRWEIKFFRAWLGKLTQNYCLMELRKDKRMPVVHPEFPEQFVESADDFHLALEKENRLQQLETALLEIPTEQQQCIRWFYFEKKSYQDIMQLSGFSFMQVKSYIQNGKRNLKIRLQSIQHD